MKTQKLILENWRAFIEEEKKKNRTDDYPSVAKEKRMKAIGKPDRSSWVAGSDELRSLARGIAEDDTEACGSNPYRDDLGRMSSAKDAKVYTTGYSDDKSRQDCKKQSKWKASGGGKGGESDKKCGRNPKTGKKYNIRCKDNEVLFQEYMQDDGFIKIKPDALEDIVSKLIDKEFEESGVLSEGYSKEQVAQFCNKQGYSTMQQFLNKQNAMVASAKGDLNKKQK
jgi:hypothetical protein